MVLCVQSKAQDGKISSQQQEIAALQAALRRFHDMEPKYEETKAQLQEAQQLLEERSQAIVLWQRADERHKALFGSLAELDPEAMTRKLDDTLQELRLIRDRQVCIWAACAFTLMSLLCLLCELHCAIVAAAIAHIDPCMAFATLIAAMVHHCCHTGLSMASRIRGVLLHSRCKKP